MKKNKEEANKFEAQVKKIFGSIGGYTESPKNKVLCFSVYFADLTFDNLERLSILIGTKNINIHVADDGRCHDSHNAGEYCYCSNSSEIEIYCDDVTF